MTEWLQDPEVAILLTGCLVGTAAALLGPFLILRRNSMLADAISHAIVFGIMAVWLMTGLISGPLLIVGAGVAGVLCVWLIEVVTNTGKVKEDAAIGLVFPAMFAGGVLLLNLFARDVHIDVHTVLLGEIGFVWLDTVQVAGVDVPNAVLWMSGMAAINALFVGLFWKELKLATFDPVLAAAFGMMPRLLFYGLLLLTSATAVAAFDAVGAILFVAFVIVPPATAYLLTDRLIEMVLIGIVVSLVSVISGYYLAVGWDVSISGMMALMTGACLALAVTFGPRYGLVTRLRRRRDARLANDVRALMVHLHSHEATEERVEENVAEALVTHLNWPEIRAKSVMARAIDRGFLVRSGHALDLTEKGRDLALSLLEPWRR
ncbi:metal ABC transporter permease [Rhodobacteraceae bacterium NNCM2]|nr:metal ABC transporter permease [Coraliihabitans acroporae]